MMILLVGATSEETKPETKLWADTSGMDSMTIIFFIDKYIKTCDNSRR